MVPRGTMSEAGEIDEGWGGGEGCFTHLSIRCSFRNDKRRENIFTKILSNPDLDHTYFLQGRGECVKRLGGEFLPVDPIRV